MPFLDTQPDCFLLFGSAVGRWDFPLVSIKELSEVHREEKAQLAVRQRAVLNAHPTAAKGVRCGVESSSKKQPRSSSEMLRRVTPNAPIPRHSQTVM